MSGVLVFNARIFTAVNKSPWAEAIACTGGKIVFVGSNAEAAGLFQSFVCIDARQRLLVPGFNDAHIHLSRSCVEGRFLGCEQAHFSTADELRAALLAHLLVSGDGWLIAHSVDSVELPSPARQYLDGVCSQRAILLLFRDGRCYANTRALRSASLFTDAPTFVDATLPRSQADGLPTGELSGEAGQLLRYAAEFPGDLRYLARCGITSAQVMGADVYEFRSMLEQERSGLLPVRLMYALDKRSFANAHACLRENSAKVRVGALKLYLDGLVENRTCCLLRRDLAEPEPPKAPSPASPHPTQATTACGCALRGPPPPPPPPPPQPPLVQPKIATAVSATPPAWAGLEALQQGFGLSSPDNGKAHFSVAELAHYLRQAEPLGLQVCVHATGDGAVRRVLDAVELHQRASALSGSALPRSPRHRIEHVELCHPADLARFGVLGVIASMSPLHATSVADEEAYMDKVPPDLLHEGLFALQTIRRGGAHVPFGSDYPVVDYNPLLSLAAALERNPEGQRFTLEDAIHGYTTEAAYAERQEHVKGSLQPGMLADFVLLSGDPFAPGVRLSSLSVVLTVCSGEIVFADVAQL